MRGFEIQEEQITALAAALTADELARNFSVFTDFVSQSEWTGDTILGSDGLDLTASQIAACAARCCRFFDLPEEAIESSPRDCFATWAQILHPLVRNSLGKFRFLPATQAGSAETRQYADEIFQDAQQVASLMHGRRRVVTMVSPHSLFGFVTTIAAPNLQHLPILDARPMHSDELAQQLAFGDLLVATPTLWRYLSETLSGFADNVVGISFGEALSAGLASDLRGKGLGAMRELYGSTETGIIAWRDSPADPFVLFDHWARDGRSIIRIRPAGNRRNMTAMDFMEWETGRSFHLGGRRDGAIQIGAVNVFPRTIARIIAGHENVKKCAVRVSQRAQVFDQLIAHIELEEGAIPGEEMAWEINRWCQKKLRPPERPRIYTFVEEITAELDPISGSTENGLP